MASNWTYRIYTTTENVWQFLSIEFRCCERGNAATDLASAAEYNDEVDYYVQRLQTVKAETCGSTYFRDHLKSSLAIRFQGDDAGGSSYDLGPSDWYGPSIDNSELSEHVGRAITKLAKLPYDAQPADFIAALKATPVKYLSEIDVFVKTDPSKDSDFDMRSPAQRAAA